MINQMVKAILEQVKEQYPGVGIPSALQAVITSAEKLDEVYTTDCKILCEDNGKEYHCKVEHNFYLYNVKVLDNNGHILEKYPELVEIKSRQQYEIEDVVQVVFLGNELEPAIVGG